MGGGGGGRGEEGKELPGGDGLDLKAPNSFPPWCWKHLLTIMIGGLVVALGRVLILSVSFLAAVSCHVIRVHWSGQIRPFRYPL